MRTYLLATSNEGKIVEMKECLVGLSLKLLPLKGLPNLPAPPEETGSSHRENAIEKATYYFTHTDLPTIAEDSGIHVEALEGELGIHTRRWGAGPTASDEEWIQHFLARMRKEQNKRARFHCVIAFVNGKNTHTFEGECLGTITDTLETPYLPGLPISACFRPDGYDKVFSALSVEEKNRVSHRGKALHQLMKFLMNRVPARRSP